MGKKGGKGKRREPVRHPIPAARLTASPSVPQEVGGLRLPQFDGVPTAGPLLRGPLEAVPLYAVITAMYQEMSGRAVNACLPVCAQMAGALEHLGFEAEVMAACVRVYQGARRYADIGVQGPAIVHRDWTTNGHTIVWAESFGRLVDPTVAQHPELYRAAHDTDLTFGLPIVLPIGSRRTLLAGAVGGVRDPYELAYLAQPEHTGVFDPWLAQFAEALDYGALSLAHRALIILQAAGQMRNLRQLPHTYPRLGELLDGRAHLAAIPDAIPEAVARLAAVSVTRP